MAITELLKVVPPPTSPKEAYNELAWETGQESLGVALPNDFREVGVRYGSGKFCGYIGALNPLSEDFTTSIIYLLEVLRDIAESRKYPYKVFPDHPGLLPWGGDDNGHMLHWLTEGDADNWPVIIESHEGDLERYDLSMTTFLAKALTNEIRPKHIWGRPFTEDELVFLPTPPKKTRKK